MMLLSGVFQVVAADAVHFSRSRALPPARVHLAQRRVMSMYEVRRRTGAAIRADLRDALGAYPEVAAVGLAQSVLERAVQALAGRRALSQHGAEGLAHRRAVLRMHQVEQRRTGGGVCVGRMAEHFRETLGVDAGIGERVPVHEAGFGRTHQQREALALARQRLLHRVALGDVPGGADHADRAALLIADCDAVLPPPSAGRIVRPR